MKNITRERKILENRRLDLDACKGKVRKARAMQLQPVVSYPSSIYIRYIWIIHHHLPSITCVWLIFRFFLSMQKEGVDPRALLDQVCIEKLIQSLLLQFFNPYLDSSIPRTQ